MLRSSLILAVTHVVCCVNPCNAKVESSNNQTGSKRVEIGTNGASKPLCIHKWKQGQELALLYLSCNVPRLRCQRDSNWGQVWDRPALSTFRARDPHPASTPPSAMCGLEGRDRVTCCMVNLFYHSRVLVNHGINPWLDHSCAAVPDLCCKVNRRVLSDARSFSSRVISRDRDWATSDLSFWAYRARTVQRPDSS